MKYLEKVEKFNKYMLELQPEMRSQAEKFNNGNLADRNLMRALMNVCEPKCIDSEMYALQDEILKEDLKHKGIVSTEDMLEAEQGIYLWQGDITRIKCGAVVNAANSKMLGCFVPLHSCIDNAIHSAAGLQLRSECRHIMQKQGYDEPTGQAKITKAYNLPCKSVIHTVGPIVFGGLTQKHCSQLEDSYRACFKSAVDNKLDSIAFCCISTGVFAFPNRKAAEIAVKTIRKLKENYSIKVIFNVFKEEDLKIYESLLKQHN